jgi:hypothetical protein
MPQPDAAERDRAALHDDEVLRLALTKLDILWSTVTIDLPALLKVVPRPSEE